jgi:hypothetical protein
LIKTPIPGSAVVAFDAEPAGSIGGNRQHPAHHVRTRRRRVGDHEQEHASMSLTNDHSVTRSLDSIGSAFAHGDAFACDWPAALCVGIWPDGWEPGGGASSIGTDSSIAHLSATRGYITASGLIIPCKPEPVVACTVHVRVRRRAVRAGPSRARRSRRTARASSSKTSGDDGPGEPPAPSRPLRLALRASRNLDRVRARP